MVTLANEEFVDREIDNSIDDESIYSEDVRNALIDDDEITPYEEAFMKGYEEADEEKEEEKEEEKKEEKEEEK